MEESTQSHTTRNVLIALALLAVVFVGCCGCFAAGLAAVRTVGQVTLSSGIPRMQFNLQGLGDRDERVRAERAFSETFRTGDGGHLVVNVPVGEVRIEGTDGDTVVVSGRVTARGSDDATAQEKLARYRLDIARDGTTVRVTGEVDQPAGGWRNNPPQVDLTVRVPRDTSVEVDGDVGDVRLEGTAADADIQTDVARVVLADVSPAEKLTVRTGVGAIEFDGTLVDGASYEFRSDVGAIRIRVPRDSRFELDASSGMGAVRCDFPVEGQSSGGLPGRSLKGAVNGGGDTTVKAESGVGAISVESR